MSRFLYVFRPRATPLGHPLMFQVYEEERPTAAQLRELPRVVYSCRLPDDVAPLSLAEIERWYTNAAEYGGLPPAEARAPAASGSLRKLGERHTPLRSGDITLHPGPGRPSADEIEARPLPERRRD